MTLLGHSMGGMVAQEVVARRPELVSKLILCGTSPSFGKPDGDWQREFVAARARPRSTPARPWRSWRSYWCRADRAAARCPRALRLATHCMATDSRASTYPARAGGAWSTFDRRANLPQIQVPTLLIAGEHDRNAPPAVMKKMADAIPRSTYMEMRGVGHLQNLEAPDDFDNLVLNFLALPPALLH